jgi:hypothetical protein
VTIFNVRVGHSCDGSRDSITARRSDSGTVAGELARRAPHLRNRGGVLQHGGDLCTEALQVHLGHDLGGLQVGFDLPGVQLLQTQPTAQLRTEVVATRAGAMQKDEHQIRAN